MTCHHILGWSSKRVCHRAFEINKNVSRIWAFCKLTRFLLLEEQEQVRDIFRVPKNRKDFHQKIDDKYYKTIMTRI